MGCDPYGLGESVGIDAEDVGVLKIHWRSSIAKQEHQEVDSLLVVSKVADLLVNTVHHAVYDILHLLPESLVVRKAAAGVLFSGMRKGWELCPVANRKHGLLSY